MGLKNRKGISPLIAAVLLIAFVMSVGGLMSEWVLELTDESTQAASDRQSDILECSGNTIEFLNVDQENEEVEVLLQASGSNLGEVTVTSYPSLEQNQTFLEHDRSINSTVLEVGSEPQDRVSASSIRCDISTEIEIN